MFSHIRRILPGGRPEPHVVQIVAIRLLCSDEDDARYLSAEFIFDDHHLEAFDFGPVDLIQLVRSSQSDGTYFIWTCWCGCPGCGGNRLGVEVRTVGACLEWSDRDLNRTYILGKAKLLQALEICRTEARRMLAADPSLVWAPEVNCEFA
ncbi:MAG TPA: hypothetical protein P5081_24125 [Phycisphaerae bacterium]|nr:hypothetical protein [Phycisphaerae bacterium]HRW55974.1 hypothetical protein [Phycisphaerae bacterium]